MPHPWAMTDAERAALGRPHSMLAEDDTPRSFTVHFTKPPEPPEARSFTVSFTKPPAAEARSFTLTVTRRPGLDGPQRPTLDPPPSMAGGEAAVHECPPAEPYRVVRAVDTPGGAP